MWVEEMEFTQHLIERDFSNFSAWHHRTIALGRFSVELLDRVEFVSKGFLIAFSPELEVLHNALFTDPNDQSVWIYYRWLLSHPSDTTPPKLCSVSSRRVDERLLILMTVKFLKTSMLDGLSINKDALKSHQRFVFKVGKVFSIIVLRIEQTDSDVEIDFLNKKISLKISSSFSYQLFVSSPDFGIHARNVSVLESELRLLNRLKSFEPNNSNLLLTLVDLMVSVDFEANREEIEGIVNHLISIDRVRKGYYLTLSTFILVYNS